MLNEFIAALGMLSVTDKSWKERVGPRFNFSTPCMKMSRFRTWTAAFYAPGTGRFHAGGH